MTARAALAWALLLSAGTGLCGLRWGVPSRERLAAFPEALKPTPEVAAKFAAAWAELYRGIEKVHRDRRGEEPVTYVKGLETVRAGWSWPPPKLLNSYRSLLLRSEQPDEQKPFIVLSRMRPWRLEFEPLWVHYGGAFIYPLGAWLQGLAWLGAVRLVPDMGHYLMNPDDMGGLYTAGRLLILLAHLGTAWLLFDLGRRLSGPRAGFFAAALFAVSPLAVITIHSLKPHPYSAFWVLAALRFSVMAAESGAARAYGLAGLCAGMAAGSNFSFLPILACLPLAWLLRRREAAKELGRVAAALGLAALVFLLTNPYAVFMRANYVWETTVYTSARPAPSLGGLLALFGPFTAWQLGAGTQLLAAAGLVLAWRRGSGRPRRLLAAAALGGSVVVWLGLAFLWGFVDGPEALRFFYPMAALFCLFAADSVRALPAPWARALLLLALLDAGVRGAPYLMALHRDAGPEGTRPRAAAWIAAHVPAGARLGLPRYPQPATTPVFRYDLYDLVLFDSPGALPAQGRPDFILTDSSGRGPVQSELSGEYALAAAFEPSSFLWGRLRDPSFFADAPMYVFRREAAPAKTSSGRGSGRP